MTEPDVNRTPSPFIGMTCTVDYVVIGHVTHDLQMDGSIKLGGTASYSALTAAQFNQAVGIVTSHSADFVDGISGNGVHISTSPAPVTTTFCNIYHDGQRQQRIFSVANTLNAALLPGSWRCSRIAHIGPVINECEPDLMQAFTPDTFIGVTPQGWMRYADTGGLVHPRQLPRHIVTDVLHYATAVVISLDDIQGRWEYAAELAAATPLLVVTSGWQGGVYYHEGRRSSFPAPTVTEKDPTGAGDIFAAVFFTLMAQGMGPMVAAHGASCIAAQSVARSGLASIPTPEDLRLCRIYADEGN